jgi:signal transduction histidine kinase
LIINADKDRLSRAIRNIIDNVVKHAAEGKYLGIFLKKDDEKTITLNIMDKGKGIPESDSEKIFKRFYKNSQVQGMGIGLSITREIIKKHNGNITVKSCNDTGSCFIITLPLYI